MRNSGYAGVPSSTRSRPSISSPLLSRIPIVYFKANHVAALAVAVKIPIAEIPTNWVSKWTSGCAKLAANVPHIPANKWTGIAPTTSSILNLSIKGIVMTIIVPPTAPISTAWPISGVNGLAVMLLLPRSSGLVCEDFQPVIKRSSILWRKHRNIRFPDVPVLASISVYRALDSSTSTSFTSELTGRKWENMPFAVAWFSVPQIVVFPSGQYSMKLLIKPVCPHNSPMWGMSNAARLKQRIPNP